MKNKIAIIVDSSSGISDGEYKHVFVIPLLISEKANKKIVTYHDGIDINEATLCGKMLNNSDISTSQSTSGESINFIEKIFKNYEKIFLFPLPSKLGGNYNS
jgi:fatty acid-binding protein DegV